MGIRLWHWLISIPGTGSPEVEVRGRFLASLLIVALPLMAIIGLGVLPHWLSPEAPMSSHTFWGATLAVCGALVAYVCNRRGRTSFGAGLFIATLCPALVLAALDFPGNIQFVTALNILTLALLPGRAAPLVAIAITLAEYAVLFITNPEQSELGFVSSLSCTLFVLALLVVVRLYHDDLEARRMDAARARERWFATTLASIGDGVLTVDCGQRVTFINAVAQHLTGYAGDSALGLAASQVFQIENEYTGEEAVSPIPRVLEDGKIVGLANHTALVSRDGTKRPIADSGAPIVDDNGVIRGVVLVFRDQTETHAVQARLEHSQRLDALGQLAGGVAHDFNNLLTVIGGGAELALGLVPQEHPARIEIEDVLFATERAVALTSQLLAFSRRQVMQAKAVAFNDAVQDATRLLRRLLPERVAVQTVLAEQAGFIQVDTVQFEQVVINLALNAADAMPDGGELILKTSMLTLTEPNSELAIGAGNYGLLQVKDTGIGMDEAVSRKVFEPFFTTKARGRGTGLGLATVYGIVQQSGGAVQVVSKTGAGTEFFVYLPATGAPSNSVRPEAMPKSGPSSHTVLLIEDDPLVRKLAERALASAGFVVLVAASGAEGLRLLAAQERPIDLLVTDVIMPEMSGTEAARAVRKRQPDVRILYMSGYADEVLAREGVGEAAAFLAKPFSAAALCAAVERALGTPESTRQKNIS